MQLDLITNRKLAQHSWPSQDPIGNRPPPAFESEKMTAWKVDKTLGNVKNDRLGLIESASPAPEEVEEGVEDSPGPLFS
jgi:hypothetical protein